MKALMLVLTLFSNPVFARTDFEPFRPELIRAGDSFLDGKSTADDFIAEARTLRARASFSEDERAYLTDLTRRLPADLRSSACPSMEDGLCAIEPVGLIETGLAEATLTAAAASKSGPAGLPPAEAGSQWEWSQTAKWAIAFGLILAAGSSAMSGKEIQVRSR